MSTDRSTRTTKDARRDAARDRARALREQAAKKQRQRRVLGLSAGVVAVLVVVAVVALLISRAGGGATAAGAAPAGVSGGGGVVTGAASAPHTVTIYQDYQCPICKAFDTATGPWLEQQRDAGTTKIEYRPISILDRASSGTQYSTRSANAAFCVAGAQGADFTKFNDAMYAEQPEENGSGLPDSRLITLAQQAGAGSVGTCITDRTHADFVASTTDTALKPTAQGGGGVSGTPTVLVDGKVVTGSNGPPTQAELAAALGVAG